MKIFFTNKHWKGDSDIKFTKNDEILLENNNVVDVLNNYFLTVTSLDPLSVLDGYMNLTVTFIKILKKMIKILNEN